LEANSRDHQERLADVDLDPSGMRVPEGIPQGFRRNLVVLVTKNRMELSRLAFDGNVECRSDAAAVGREFCTQRADCQSEIVLSVVEDRNPCTASRPSVIAAAACAMAVSSRCFATDDLSSNQCDTVWKRRSTAFGNMMVAALSPLNPVVTLVDAWRAGSFLEWYFLTSPSESAVSCEVTTVRPSA
jgi:hypothetical protein